MANIQSVGTSSAWIDFMKTAEAARRRNQAGFTPATAPARTGLPTRHIANDNGQPVATAHTSPLASKLYGTAEPQVRTTGVGKLFDAYA